MGVMQRSSWVSCKVVTRCHAKEWLGVVQRSDLLSYNRVTRGVMRRNDVGLKDHRKFELCASSRRLTL